MTAPYEQDGELIEHIMGVTQRIMAEAHVYRCVHQMAFLHARARGLPVSPLPFLWDRFDLSHGSFFTWAPPAPSG